MLFFKFKNKNESIKVYFVEFKKTDKNKLEKRKKMKWLSKKIRFSDLYNQNLKYYNISFNIYHFFSYITFFSLIIRKNF